MGRLYSFQRPAHALTLILALLPLALNVAPATALTIARFLGQEPSAQSSASANAPTALTCRRLFAKRANAVAACWRASQKRCYFYTGSSTLKSADPLDVAYLKQGSSTPAPSMPAPSMPAPSSPTGSPSSGGGSKGSWSGPYAVDVLPVGAALLRNGKVLLFSNWDNSGAGKYKNLQQRKTHTTIWNPRQPKVKGRVVITNTQHDMFCPGLVTLPDGRVHVSGGSTDRETSIYNPGSNSWSRAEPLVIGRGYQSNVVLGDGRVFTIGGSWSGKLGGKAAEIWAPRGGWKLIPKIRPEPIYTDDKQGVYRQDNHAWLFTWTNNKILHAGPSTAMHVFDLKTSGTRGVGSRGRMDQMNGGAVMYDSGKILTMGGAPDYDTGYATAQAHEIKINNLDSASVSVVAVGSMSVPRAFSCATVLPDGKTLVTGGMRKVKLFSDDTAELAAELYDPATRKFTLMAKMRVPRTYHSVALLLPDGRVMTGGGGLCGNCNANHYNLEIFTPPYLTNGKASKRPRITSMSQSAPRYGQSVTVTTSKPVQYFALVRTGSSTHALNSDQRRIVPQHSSAGGNKYTIKMPSDRGIAPPGIWMCFALDSAGVPSVAKMVRLR